MTHLWYSETVNMTGRWSPRLTPDAPQTIRVGGHLREKLQGSTGMRIRRICEVPAHLQAMPLGSIAAVLFPVEDASAVTPPPAFDLTTLISQDGPGVEE